MFVDPAKHTYALVRAAFDNSIEQLQPLMELRGFIGVAVRPGPQIVVYLDKDDNSLASRKTIDKMEVFKVVTNVEDIEVPITYELHEKVVAH